MVFLSKKGQDGNKFFNYRREQHVSCQIKLKNPILLLNKFNYNLQFII